MRMMPSMIPRALLMAVLAWLVPGLGHAGQKCWWKAIYFGILVLGTFALGVWLGDGASVSEGRAPWHLYGQYGAALPAWIAERLGEAPTGETIDRLELGLLFTTVAGILNVVVVVDAYELARRKVLEA
jgi:hypothetical protein